MYFILVDDAQQFKGIGPVSIKTDVIVINKMLQGAISTKQQNNWGKSICLRIITAYLIFHFITLTPVFWSSRFNPNDERRQSDKHFFHGKSGQELFLLICLSSALLQN